MADKKQKSEAVAPIGVLSPSGDAARVDSLTATPRYWNGPVVGKDGSEHLVFGTSLTRQGTIRLSAPVNGQRVNVGTLERVNNHYEGKLGEREIGAFFRSLERGRRSKLRMVIMPIEGMTSRSSNGGNGSAPAAPQVSLSDALAELGPLNGERTNAPATVDTEDTPF
jgi:hypothetical protein